MANDGGMAGARINPWRIGGWGLAAVLLLLPLVAMRFTREVNWTPFDFVFAAALIGSVGGAFELAVRMTASWLYRAGAAVALGAAFLTVWATGAVGMIGDEGNPYNLLFVAVIALALAGAMVVRFRAGRMARVMSFAGLLYAGVAIGGYAEDPRGATLSLVFAGFWLVSAALFRKAALSPKR